MTKHYLFRLLNIPLNFMKGCVVTKGNVWIKVFFCSDSLVPQGQGLCVRCPLGLNTPFDKLNPYGFTKYKVLMQQMGPFFYSMKMAPSENQGPGHSELCTWCTCWNGGQTEWTSHAYESSMWAWTKSVLPLFFYTLPVPRVHLNLNNLNKSTKKFLASLLKTSPLITYSQNLPT